ncbi:hypothetical protein BKA56DRAFT_582702 [Ilyonectria sp. MPI-CAGE-AT-0026]|nr:hypothetical protein BKA56DRAFT_582702 [Ilyonectria sp. MPI-CAGE-AT-0026]
MQVTQAGQGLWARCIMACVPCTRDQVPVHGHMAGWRWRTLEPPPSLPCGVPRSAF